MRRGGEGAAAEVSQSDVTLGFCVGVVASFLCRVGLAHVRALLLLDGKGATTPTERLAAGCCSVSVRSLLLSELL